MQIRAMSIRNFKSVQEITISDIGSAFIIVGRNGTGKTVILQAILAATGRYRPRPTDFQNSSRRIEIVMNLSVTEEDLTLFYKRGKVSTKRQYGEWIKEFAERIPGFIDGMITFTYVADLDGAIFYEMGDGRQNTYIKEILPKIHFIDHTRDMREIENDIFYAQGEAVLAGLRDNVCMKDSTKRCDNCFLCMKEIMDKRPEELSAFETTKLLEYKLYKLNMDSFMEKLNYFFRKNSTSAEQICYAIDFNIDRIFSLHTFLYNANCRIEGDVAMMSAGTKSIYILSLLEAYMSVESSIPCIIMMEAPEIYLHPQMQKVASEILYRLSKKNQIIFSTHSPTLIFNFNSRQIKQTVLNEEYHTMVYENTDLDEILNDLGYSANDLINVSFVFIVEGKQDYNRLPLLLRKYYAGSYDAAGNLKRIAIIPTNSCTNIKTYANLKYMNKCYLKDQFLMIRDGDGLDPYELKEKLCNYYEKRRREDMNQIPRIVPENVLILKYYSFENYFLDPASMVKIGVIQSEEEFYQILYTQYEEYLHKLTSVRRMIEKTGIQITSPKDVKTHIETIKIYVRGHNLFDLFYGKYKGDAEKKILEQYVDVAPREVFSDILDAIDSFIYFDSRKG
ncbi:MAG: OLD family endonuclease [Lachnospiraceae bacterium]|nr:OLD family endonuclease [Lachnospiraceae bacterium]